MIVPCKAYFQVLAKGEFSSAEVSALNRPACIVRLGRFIEGCRGETRDLVVVLKTGACSIFMSLMPYELECGSCNTVVKKPGLPSPAGV